MADFNMEDVEEMIITLEDEDGSALELEIIMVFEYDGKDYAAATPTDEDSEEVYFFGWEAKEKKGSLDVSLENLEDDDLLEELFEAFMEVQGEGDEFDELDELLATDDDDEDEDDSKWDEFINKNLED